MRLVTQLWFMYASGVKHGVVRQCVARKMMTHKGVAGFVRIRSFAKPPKSHDFGYIEMFTKVLPNGYQSLVDRRRSCSAGRCGSCLRLEAAAAPTRPAGC